MKPRKQDFALGLTAILFLALFLATVLFLVPSLSTHTRHIVVHFPHEEGLAPLKRGSLVLLSGAVEVGHVTSVVPRELPAKPGSGRDRQTVVVVEADVDASLPLYGDCEITSDMPLVGGSGTLVISNVGTPSVPLPRGPIEGLPPQGMAAISSVSRQLTGEGGLIARLDRMLDPDVVGSLLNKIMVSVADINAMTGELRTQLSVEEQRTLLSKLHLMLDDLNATTTSVREQLQAGNGAGLIAKLHAALDVVHQDLTELLGTLTENRPLVNSALASIEHTTRVLDEQMLARLQAELNRDNPDSLLSKLHAGMDHLNAAVADLEVVSETGKRMLVLSRPQVERIIANVEDMSAVLTQTSKDIQLNPARLIWGPARPTESKIAVLTAARDFAQAATYLNDTAARLQAILAAGPEGRQVSESDAEVREIYESLRSAFERWQRAETFFWDQMK